MTHRMLQDLPTQDPRLLDAAARDAEALGEYEYATHLRERAERIRLSRQTPNPAVAA